MLHMFMKVKSHSNVRYVITVFLKSNILQESTKKKYLKSAFVQKRLALEIHIQLSLKIRFCSKNSNDTFYTLFQLLFIYHLETPAILETLTLWVCKDLFIKCRTKQSTVLLLCLVQNLMNRGKYSSYSQILPSKIELPSFFKRYRIGWNQFWRIILIHKALKTMYALFKGYLV